MKQTEDVGRKEMLPNSFSVPIAKRIRQAIGNKLLLFTSGTQKGTVRHPWFNTGRLQAAAKPVAFLSDLLVSLFASPEDLLYSINSVG